MSYTALTKSGNKEDHIFRDMLHSNDHSDDQLSRSATIEPTLNQLLARNLKIIDILFRDSIKMEQASPLVDHLLIMISVHRELEQTYSQRSLQLRTTELNDAQRSIQVLMHEPIEVYTPTSQQSTLYSQEPLTPQSTGSTVSQESENLTSLPQRQTSRTFTMRTVHLIGLTASLITIGLFLTSLTNLKTSQLTSY